MNDRPFGAERAAGANADGRRDRFEDRHFGFDAALGREHRLHRFGDAVASDFRRSILGHEANEQPADDGNDNDPQAELIFRGTAKMKRPDAKEGEVGE